MLWAKLSPPHPYIEVLTPRTFECGLGSSQRGLRYTDRQVGSRSSVTRVFKEIRSHTHLQGRPREDTGEGRAVAAHQPRTEASEGAGPLAPGAGRTRLSVVRAPPVWGPPSRSQSRGARRACPPQPRTPRSRPGASLRPAPLAPGRPAPLTLAPLAPAWPLPPPPGRGQPSASEVRQSVPDMPWPGPACAEPPRGPRHLPPVGARSECRVSHAHAWPGPGLCALPHLPGLPPVTVPALHLTGSLFKDTSA